MHKVKSADFLDHFRIRITFEDAKTKIVDLKDHIAGEIFKPLQDLSYFKTFIVNEDLDTITWSNGADMSPDFLYEIGK